METATVGPEPVDAVVVGLADAAVDLEAVDVTIRPELVASAVV